jgi:hypothetical protein
MSAVKTVIAVVLLMTLFSCKKDSTGPSDPGDYLPLTVGNQWSYSVSGYLKTGNRDSIPVTGSKLMAITGSTTHQSGFDLFILKDSSNTVMTMPDSTYTTIKVETVYICKVKDVGYRIYKDTVTTDFELLLKLPVVLNDSWVPRQDQPTNTRVVRSVSSSVTVPAGSYTGCVNLRDTNTSAPASFFDVFISRGDGIVKFVLNTVSSAGTMYLDMNLASSVVK